MGARAPEVLLGDQGPAGRRRATGGYGRNHRKVRLPEGVIRLREHDFTRVVSRLDSPHNLHTYEEIGMPHPCGPGSRGGNWPPASPLYAGLLEGGPVAIWIIERLTGRQMGPPGQVVAVHPGGGAGRAGERAEPGFYPDGSGGQAGAQDGRPGQQGWPGSDHGSRAAKKAPAPAKKAPAKRAAKRA